ncbi:Mini-ribonuclease 3 [uncultured Megasphaera sp.]|uniref:Mini-ribonuclease 3 n=1 Tax=uncultured Megasphaera sp. TaxID=165188 RepID=UPI002593E0E0|nr:ribonuclease III domain-containing protein [uncultured Megasphaera sp.]
MKFKALQALKAKSYAAFAKGERLDVPRVETAQLDPISLAFVGDAWYAQYMRRQLVALGIPNVQVMHTLAAEFVSARVQAAVYRQLKDQLHEQEAAVCQRARNAYSQTPKSASVAEYHDSTALEALVGYLVLSKQQERLAEMMERICQYTRDYCRAAHGAKE